MKLRCVNTASDINVAEGTTLLDISRGLDLPFRPICAHVNNKNQGLEYRVFSPKTVEFFPSWSEAGDRVYIRSLSMILYKAVTDLYPGTRLRIEHFISRGYFCRLFNGQEVTDDVIAALLKRMREIVSLDLPFERHEEPREDVIALFTRHGLNDKVRLLKSLHDLYCVYYTLDGTPDSYYGPLAPSSSLIDVFDLKPYKNGFLMLGRQDSSDQPRVPIAQEKLYRAFTHYLRFNQIIGIRNVGEMNRAANEGRSDTVINIAEALHTKYITNIADTIAERYHHGSARIVMIAGPSSSGKTTFTKRLAIQLLANELRPRMISLDNYFIDRHLTPRDEDGDYDFESLYALDLKQFNEDLNALLRGETVELPYYNFELGTRQYRGEIVTLGENTILLIEGIHGLNPELTASVPEDQKYRIYVSALTTLAIDDHNWVPTTDNRLLRRIIRDRRYRGVSALETIRRWPSVRRGEERWIFPYQENADAMFNSSLIFELAVMRDEADEVLRQVPRDTPEYATAWRLRRFLACFAPISDKAIPPTSLLREFLGGSSFHY